MTLLVRDEQDIIKANIEYHLSQGVDSFIATDNQSRDRTTEILKEYEGKGILRYLYEPSDEYHQGAWVTRMARLAYDEHSADWVINNDADEFWWPKSGNLKAVFGAIGSEYNVISAERSNFVPVLSRRPRYSERLGLAWGWSWLCEDILTEEIDCLAALSDKAFYNRMVFRDTLSLSLIGTRRVAPKMAHRASPTIEVFGGNHDVNGISKRPYDIDSPLEIFHFNVRNYNQLVKKISPRGEALMGRQGIGLQLLYEQVLLKGRLRNYFLDQLYTVDRIKKGLKTKRITTDRRLASYLQRLATELYS